MVLEMIAGAIAGLGLFLFGMKMMADGLQKVAGNKLKGVVRSLTRNRFLSVIIGMIVTMIIQSSSATSVMVVGFVNAGIMNLSQATGVIFGANIGTTITGQLVSFNLSTWAPIAIGLGFITSLVTKSPKVKEIADIFIGFGILFVGMTYLKEALAPLKEMPVFTDMIRNYGENPLLGIGIGLVMTIAIQSSSATIGVLIALASQGILPITTAMYIIYGDNIGTCTTALISSLTTSRKGKRVAMVHLTFNIIGTTLFMLVLNNYVRDFVVQLNPNDIGRQIANAHSLFNIINVILLFPFMGAIIKLVEWLVPDATDTALQGKGEGTQLDERFLQTPGIALKHVVLEYHDMAREAGETLRNAISACKERDKDFVNLAEENERNVNAYEKNIMEYLVRISQENVSVNDSQVMDSFFNAINDLERISDHASNIAEFAEVCIDKDLQLDEEVTKQLNHVYQLVLTGYELTITALAEGNIDKADQAIAIEREIDQLKISIRDSHIKRMNKRIATPESGIFVMDLLSNLERVSDHFRNICEFAKIFGDQLKIYDSAATANA